jgi:ribosomal protein S18 acetylase RimI-like enzyme
MQNITFTIERITRHNYHMVDDMVYWRMNCVELTKNAKHANGRNDFTKVFKDLEHPGFHSYAALCDGRFVGWISMMYTPKIGRRRWAGGVIYVDELWTAPEFRRRGIAAALMKEAFECQRETGAVEVRVYVGADNTAAQELYKRCGMQATGDAVYMKSSGT